MITITVGQEIELGKEVGKFTKNWLGFIKDFTYETEITKVRIKQIEQHDNFKLFSVETLDGIFVGTFTEGQLKEAMKLAHKELFVSFPASVEI